MQGQLDTALDARGRWQAEQLADALHDEPIDAIVSSDLARAMHTALPLARRRGLRVRADAALRERSFGVFQGFTYARDRAALARRGGALARSRCAVRARSAAKH